MDDVYIMRNLIAAAINRALADWHRPEMRDEIREFFNSEWGEEMCGLIDLSAQYILRGLENGTINYTSLDEEAV